MATNELKTRIKHAYKTESEWSNSNPILLKGEVAYSSDKNNKYKVGDGTHKWSELSYAKADLSKSDVTTALGYTPPTTNTTYNDATQSAHGLMSTTDKIKLDGIATGANAYSHPTYTAKSSGLYKVTIDGTGHVSAATAVTKSDITALGIPSSDTNTDTKVTNALATTTKAYVTGTTSASTNTGTQVFDTGVYLDTTAGSLHVTSIGVGNGIMSYDSTKKCIVISVS